MLIESFKPSRKKLNWIFVFGSPAMYISTAPTCIDQLIYHKTYGFTTLYYCLSSLISFEEK